MMLPDINLLIHAYDEESPQHNAARDWWDGVLAGSEGVGLAWPVILGFIRIATHRRILNNPMPPALACGIVEEWFSLPHVHVVSPAEGHFRRLSESLEALGTAGNLTTDAHLATLAIERGYILYSTDTDFARFAGLSWRNPIRAGQ
jgi:toxin-antitoxin system PIN domain toxin